MPDREKVIKGLVICYRPPAKCEDCPYNDLPGECCNDALCLDALALLEEQEEIKEQFIEAFNTIRDAYNTPVNREKILLNYLLRNACCCADGEKDGSQIKRPQKTFWDSLSEADLMEPMHHFEE